MSSVERYIISYLGESTIRGYCMRMYRLATNKQYRDCFSLSLSYPQELFCKSCSSCRLSDLPVSKGEHLVKVKEEESPTVWEFFQEFHQFLPSLFSRVAVVQLEATGIEHIHTVEPLYFDISTIQDSL